MAEATEWVGERPLMTGGMAGYDKVTVPTIRHFKYAVVWKPNDFFSSYGMRPFIALEGRNSMTLIDSKSHAIVAQCEYPLGNNNQNALAYVSLFSDFKPGEFFEGARVLEVEKRGIDILMDREQKRVLEDTYRDKLEFVRVADDHWTDPISLEPPRISFPDEFAYPVLIGEIHEKRRMDWRL